MKNHPPQAPIFNPDDYRDDLNEFDLTEEQENELLEALWNIMSSFVAIGFGLDSVQLFSTAECEDLPENSGSDSGNRLKRIDALTPFNPMANPSDDSDKEI